MFQAPRQLHAALCHLGVGRIHVFIGRFQVQHGRGNFHGDRGRRRLTGFDGALDRMRHGARQLATFRVHFQDRLAHHCKLVVHGFEPVGVAAGQRRPGFRGSRNAFSHLHQHRRVKSAKLGHAVIERLGLHQFVGLAHGRQNRCAGGCRRYSLGAEKKQILRQTVRDAGVSFGERGILQQDARRTPLQIDIAWAQPQGAGLKEACANFPKHPRWELGLCLGQTQGQAGQLRRRVGVSNFHQPKHRLIQLAAHRRFIGQGHNVDRNCGIDPLPIEWPQIGRVDAFAVNHFQHIAVLHKQRHRRAGLALQHALKVLCQRETGLLHFVGGIVAAQLWPLNELLRQGLHRAQHFGRSAEPDHLQGTHGLVQLLARDAQLAGVQAGEVRTAGQFGIAHESPHGLGGAVQGFFQFLQHPGQRPQVIGDGGFGFVWDCDGLHGWIGSCRMPGSSDLETRYRLTEFFGHP